MDLLIRGARSWERRIEQDLLGPLALTYPQYCILEALTGAPPHQGMTMGAVAAACHCSRGNTTVIVDKLQRRGWVHRLKSDLDRRVFHLHLTVQRRETVRKLVADVGKASPPWPTAMQQTLSALVRERP